MKKIVLFYPDITGDEDSEPLYQGLPLSVMALAAQFDSEEYEVLLVDGRVEKQPEQRVLKWLDESVVCVGISSMTSYQIKRGLAFAQFIRDSNPCIPIVWGGWHPSLMPEQTIANDLVDIVIIGQGEITFPELVQRLADKKDIGSIQNLVYKTGDKSIVHTPLAPLLDLTTVEPIKKAYRHVDMDRYIQPLWGNRRVLGYESSRGCPWRCRFCSIGATYEGHWRALPAEAVVDGVEHLYKTYEIDAVHFYDNNFFVNTQRVEKFTSLLKEREISIKWDGTAVVEEFIKLSDEFIERLKQSGFFRVIIGVESGDEEVLERINKRHRNAQVLELARKCAKHGIMASLSFMVGFPWNPEKDVRETVSLIEEIKRIAPNTEILLFIFSPYLGTELYHTALEYGMSFPDDLMGWAQYTYERANTPWISEKLLRKINRYISFFGTKDMSSAVQQFLQGGKKDDTLATR